MTHISGKLVDGLFRRVLKRDLSSELLAALAQGGLDLTGDPLEPSYPKEVWYRAVALTAAALFPLEASEAQLRRLGLHVITALTSRGLLRGPWLGVARLLGPRRALRQISGHLAESPVALMITEKGRSAVEIHVEETEQPEFLAGLIEAACTALGAEACRVTVASRTATGITFHAAWR